MSGLTFDDLRWLHLLWAVLAVAGTGLYGMWQRRRGLRRFAAAGLLPRLAPPGTGRRAVVRLGLLAAALAALVAALIGPRWGSELRPIVRRNVDLLVLLDVSRSMLARDLAPSRLERARLALRDDLLPALGGDRVGLITFAGDATLACPLTVDYGAVRLALDDVTVRSTARGGTLIGDAIRKAGQVLRDDLDTHKIVLLITDGEDHESLPVVAAANLWRDQRIPIIALALGDPERGARIPLPGGPGERYLQYAGQDVWSRADFATLAQVAQVSETGLFVPVGTRDFDLGQIYRRVVQAVRLREDAEEQRVHRPARFHPFALAALALVLLDTILDAGPRRRTAARAGAALRGREAA